MRRKLGAIELRGKRESNEDGSMRAYRHQRGLHCGSTALRNLFSANGLPLSEPMIFGLGAGLAFSLHDGARGLVPPLPMRFFIGRSLSYEEDLCESLGANLKILRFESAESAWNAARVRLDRSEAVLAFVDLLYLPYLAARGHWIGHLIALAGMRGACVLVGGLHALCLRSADAFTALANELDRVRLRLQDDSWHANEMVDASTILDRAVGLAERCRDAGLSFAQALPSSGQPSLSPPIARALRYKSARCSNSK